MKSKPLIYLASPFSSFKKTREERERELYIRFRKVCEIGGRMVKQGYHVLGPISQSHPMAIHANLHNTSWEFWKALDTNMLRRCDLMFIATMKGWDKSRGVRGEIIVAGTLEIPVYLIHPKTLEVTGPFSLQELKDIVGEFTVEDKKDIKNLLKR